MYLLRVQCFKSIFSIYFQIDYLTFFEQFVDIFLWSSVSNMCGFPVYNIMNLIFYTLKIFWVGKQSGKMLDPPLTKFSSRYWIISFGTREHICQYYCLWILCRANKGHRSRDAFLLNKFIQNSFSVLETQS